MYQAIALLCLLLIALASPAHAQTDIHRCVGANGGAVFTDQPCAALKATPVAPNAPTSDRSAPATFSPPPTLCAGSIEALRQSVIDAFAARNANRMAGLMLWSGYGRSSVIADIRSLHDLMKQPLLDIDVADAPPPSPPAPLGGISVDPFSDSAPAAATPPAPPDQLVLHTASTDGLGMPQARRFGVVRQAGCLWLRSLD